MAFTVSKTFLIDPKMSIRLKEVSQDLDRSEGYVLRMALENYLGMYDSMKELETSSMTVEL
jgi:predicted DNA-binding protein